MKNLRGRNAVITGGGSGIGRGIALALAREGVNVLVADRNAESAQTVAGELAALGVQAHGFAVDVTEEPKIAALADQADRTLGRIHLLVNSAGIAHRRPLDEATAVDWQWIMAVNFYGIVNCCKTFIPGMKAHGEPAHIVNNASVAALRLPRLVGLGLYNVSKAAVLAYTDSLRVELGDSTITCSTLIPGLVATNLRTNSLRYLSDRSKAGGSGEIVPDRNEDTPPTELDSPDRITPERCGEITVRAIKAGRQLILPQPANRVQIERRFAAWLADIDAEARDQAEEGPSTRH